MTAVAGVRDRSATDPRRNRSWARSAGVIVFDGKAGSPRSHGASLLSERTRYCPAPFARECLATQSSACGRDVFAGAFCRALRVSCSVIVQHRSGIAGRAGPRVLTDSQYGFSDQIGARARAT
jgi:hypothetical protein